jgi:hypothetical protein
VNGAGVMGIGLPEGEIFHPGFRRIAGGMFQHGVVAHTHIQEILFLIS